MVTPKLDSQNPLAVVWNFLTLPFRAIAELLDLPPIPSPFDDGAAEGPLLPTEVFPVPGVQPVPAQPWVPPPVISPAQRPSPGFTRSNWSVDLFLVWDRLNNRWGYLTRQQYQIVLGSGGAGNWELVAIIPPGGSPP